MRGRLGQADSPTVRLKLSRLLEAAQKGIALNPTAAPEGILIFVSSILGQVVPAEAESARQAEAAAEAASNANDGKVHSNIMLFLLHKVIILACFMEGRLRSWL